MVKELLDFAGYALRRGPEFVTYFLFYKDIARPRCLSSD